jgi:aminopeptidase N
MKKLVLLAVLVLVGAAVAGPFHEGKYVTAPCPPLVPVDSTHDFDVRFYRADLNLPMTTDAMTARLRIDLTPRRDNFDTFSLHMINLVCDSIRRAGNTCTFTTPSGLLHITLDQEFDEGESLSVDIYYHRNSGAEQRGFYWYERGTSGIPHAICYSTTEPSDARGWMPCFDEPWDKAERGCQISVTTPDSMSACSNGIRDSVTTSGGLRTCWWSEHHPISTYLMTFAASRWTSFKQYFPVSPTESLYMQHFNWPEDSADAVSSYRNTVDMITFFADSTRYGPYPFEKYGMVEAYPFQWGGMENQTMTMVHRYWVVYGDDNGISHEMAHQWWGDMVTCLDWRNIWLNEGFATNSADLYTYHSQGRSAFLQNIQDEATEYFNEEASDPRPVYDPPYPDHVFDVGHTYDKGAWVQHMLRYVEGDTIWSQPGIFFRTMRAYGDSFKYGNASTEDYKRIHEQMTGLELDWFFDEWIYDYGYPIYTLGWHGRQNGSNWEVVFNLSQDNSSGAPAVFHMPVEVRVSWSGGNATFRYAVDSSPQTNVFTVGGQPTSVSFDPNNWILEQHNTQVCVAEGPSASYRTTLRLAGANPAVGPVRLAYELASAATARIDIYDGSGRLARTLLDGQRQAGNYSATWDRRGNDGSRVSAGAYFCRLSTGSESRTIRLVLAD